MIAPAATPRARLLARAFPRGVSLSLAPALGSAVVLVALGAHGAASAADLDGPPPVYGGGGGWSPRSAPALWSGLYYGASIGYATGDSALDYDRPGHGAAGQEVDGFAASLTFGYNWQISQAFVLGFEGDIGYMDAGADAKTVYDGDTYQTSFGPLWATLRARAGVLLTANLLAYGTAGVAFMDVEETLIGNTPSQDVRNEDFKTGLVLGAGLEYALSSATSLKFEYLHMDFGTFDGVTAAGDSFSTDTTAEVIRAGVNFKF